MNLKRLANLPEAVRRDALYRESDPLSYACIGTGAEPPTDADEDFTSADDEALCPQCEGDGSDKWNDYCLPCAMCDGAGRLW